MPPRSQNTLALGLAVSDLRIKVGWTQEQLGRRSATHPKYVGAVERGEKNVGWEKIIVLAHALNVEPEDLVARAKRFGIRRRDAAD